MQDNGAVELHEQESSCPDALGPASQTMQEVTQLRHSLAAERQLRQRAITLLSGQST